MTRVVAGEVVAGSDTRAGFLGDLSDQGIAGGLAGFELAARQVPEAVVGGSD
jgi:hypothetical protein